MPPLLQILFDILLIQRVLLMSIRYFRIKYFCQSVCDTTPIACGDYCVDAKEKLVEILYFRHFAKHFTFTSEGKNSRNKHLKNYFDVSVVIDIGYGNTNEK